MTEADPNMIVFFMEELNTVDNGDFVLLNKKISRKNMRRLPMEDV